LFVVANPGYFTVFTPHISGLMLEGDSGEEVALWMLTSLCTSAKREVAL
jgi:hypothetical protein